MRDAEALGRLRRMIERVEEEQMRWKHADRQLELGGIREALEVASSALIDRIRGRFSLRVIPGGGSR